MAKPMTKSEIVKKLAENTELTKKGISDVLTHLNALAYKEAKNSFTKYVIFITATLSLIGCASSYKPIKPIDNPLAAQKYHITYSEKEFAINKDEAIKELINKAQPTDDAEKIKLTEIAEKYFSSIAQNGVIRRGTATSCGNLQRKLAKDIIEASFQGGWTHEYLPVENMINEYLPVENILLDTAACRWGIGGVPCLKRDYYSTEVENGSITVNYHIEIRWSYKGDHGLSSGGARLVYRVQYLECPKNDTAAADIYVTHASIKNPTTLIGQNMATIEIKWEDVQRTLNRLAKGEVKDGRDEYEADLAAIISTFNKEVSQRYKVQKSENIRSERRYKVDARVAISRIQRAIKEYKFDEAHSLFSFTEELEVVKSKMQDVASKIYFSASVFPETGGDSVIVYEVRYEPVLDTFTGKAVLSEKEISKHQKEYIDNVERALMFRK